MNHDRDDKRKSHEPHKHDEPREQSARGPGDARPRSDEAERKPSTIERRDWRGSGVCGDRHTD
jgi:hypothetical protein